MFGQFVNFFDQTAGRQRDVAHPDVEPVRAVDQREEPQHRVKVVQGFADAHEHNIADGVAGIDLCKEHLVQHLSRGQVSYLATKSGGTEGAPHAAAHLRGDTHSIPMMVAHQNGFNAVSVG